MIIKINKPVGFYEIGARAKQEDAIFPQLDKLSSDTTTIVLCDGLGGHDYGEIASDTVASALGNWVESNVDQQSAFNRHMALEAVNHAQLRLNAAAATYPSDKPMGTTMAMLVMGNNGVVAAHIGDTRIYHIRPAAGTILYRSRDHSLVNDLFVMGRLTREETEASPKKSILTRAMMPAPAAAAIPDVALITDVRAGDYFLLCSDGVTSEVKDRQLMETLQRDDLSDAMKLAEIQMMAKNGSDNRTAILLKVDNVAHENGEQLLVANEDAMCDKMVHLSAITDPEAAMAALNPALGQDSEQLIPGNDGEITPDDVPQAFVEGDGSNAVVPPAIPNEDDSLPKTGYVTGDEEVNYNYNKPKKKNNSGLKLAGLILLAGLLVAGGITTYFMLKKPKVENNTTQPATDTLRDPDVSIDSMLPPMPGDTLQVGTDVAVPPAPRISNVDLPDAGSKPSKSSGGSYQTGSGVSVPRAPKYSGSGMPYDPYEGTENFGSDVPIHDDPAPAPTSDVSERRPAQSASEPAPKSAIPESTAKPGTPPPPRPKASNDPAKSNRNVPVPMPSGRSNRQIETP